MSAMDESALAQGELGRATSMLHHDGIFATSTEAMWRYAALQHGKPATSGLATL
jgi:hypothetical protein